MNHEPTAPEHPPLRRTGGDGVAAPFALIALMVVGGAVLIVIGAQDEPRNMTIIALGVVSLVLAAGTAAITLALRASRARASTGHTGGASHQIDLLRQIYEQSMLSENAKRVMYRDREIRLLHGALEQHLQNGEYNAGLVLCDALTHQYGLGQEAEAYRARIEQARQEHDAAAIRAALQQFDQVLALRDWPAAYKEAARIKRLFPESPAAFEVDRRIAAARNDHKQYLESQFIAAAEADDVHTAMETLRQLDRYMSREDAARLGETANRIVTRHRENLTNQFKSAVNEHRWADAASAGDAIIGEFPNTKMADEVRSMIDVIRTRATQAALSTTGEGAHG